MTERTGACLCGQVSFRVGGEPLTCRVCWCRDCQHLSANGTVNAIFPSDAIDIVSGSLAEYTSTADSGNAIRRRFCPRCGSHLFAESSARPQFSVVRVGTLHDPSSLRPLVNMWTASAPAWACLDAALDAAEHQPLPFAPTSRTTA